MPKPGLWQVSFRKESPAFSHNPPAKQGKACWGSTNTNIDTFLLRSEWTTMLANEILEIYIHKKDGFIRTDPVSLSLQRKFFKVASEFGKNLNFLPGKQFFLKGWPFSQTLLPNDFFTLFIRAQLFADETLYFSKPFQYFSSSKLLESVFTPKLPHFLCTNVSKRNTKPASKALAKISAKPTKKALIGIALKWVSTL